MSRTKLRVWKKTLVDGYVRRAAENTLVQIPEAIPALVECLAEPRADVRDAAKRALLRSDPNWVNSPKAREAIPVLIQRLRSFNPSVRFLSAKTLVSIGHSRGVEVLFEFAANSKADDSHWSDSLYNLGQVGTMHAPWLQEHSLLFCTACCLRLKTGRLQKIRFSSAPVEVTYVYCRNCRGWYALVQGVKQVIGVIGDSHILPDAMPQDGRMYVPLWSDDEKKARNADVDVLEIRECQQTNYDWAIDAVLVALKNDASRPVDYVRNIPVRLIGTPALSQNVLHILENEFKGIVERK